MSFQNRGVSEPNRGDGLAMFEGCGNVSHYMPSWC